MCCTQKVTNLCYEDALAWLYQFESRGSKLGLERITQLLHHCENPQQHYPTLHITGTNGKGSVCQYLTSIFEKAGYTVGLYISPHLERFTERISINHKEIPDDDFIELVAYLQPIVKHMENKGTQPTFFEIVTALAFLYFSRKQVDYAIIEVGLGGRYDATNVIIPLVSVITNVTLEHQHILGTTVEKIAYEKGGIIKPKVPVVSAVTNPALETIKHIAAHQQAPLYVIDEETWRREQVNTMHQTFTIQGRMKEYFITTQQLGEYQGENITCAILTIELLQQKGVFFPEGSIENGIKDARNPGRMELLSTPHNILLDGAHNVSGIQQLKHTLQQDFSFHRLLLVLGILKDKDLHAMISEICCIADIIICTESVSPRACPAEQLKQQVSKNCSTAEVSMEKTIDNAIQKARQQATSDDLICITGSLFTVGEARAYLIKQ